MIRANRPWRLVGHLSRALLGVLAAGTFALVQSDLWRIATNLSDLRLSLLMLATIVIALVTLITAHGCGSTRRISVCESRSSCSTS